MKKLKPQIEEAKYFIPIWATCAECCVDIINHAQSTEQNYTEQYCEECSK